MMDRIAQHPAFAYCLPFGVYMGVLALEPLAGKAAPLVYPMKALAVALAIGWVWRRWPDLSVNRVGGTIVVGTVGFILWVALDPVLPNWREDNKAFNPWTLEPHWAVGWLLVRVVGAALLVPVMEEIFWRGFIQRWIDQEDFEKVPVGMFSVPSFFGTMVLFALAHVEFFSAMIYAALVGWWFVKTRSIGNAILAHAVTNFLLALYVMFTGSWYFW